MPAGGRALLSRFLALSCLCLLLAGGVARAQPATVEFDPQRLQPGAFSWHPEAAPSGPLLMVVSIPEQRAYLYRNGVRIAVSTVSTGKPGNETPAGVFTVLQKHKVHYSNLYDDAPMPFMQRLTWGGVALHAGRLPGYPASHGCIRLPLEFARRLFDVTDLGMTVVVSDDRAHTPEWVHPGWLAPPLSAPATAMPSATTTTSTTWTTPTPLALLASLESFEWSPQAAPAGPLTILLSSADRRLRVLRNGVQIGSAHIEFEGEAPVGTSVLQLQAGVAGEESLYVPGKPRLRWLQVSLGATLQAQPAVDELYGRIRISSGFARLLYDSVSPGTTVVVTDMPAASGTEVDTDILDSAPADAAHPP